MNRKGRQIVGALAPALAALLLAAGRGGAASDPAELLQAELEQLTGQPFKIHVAGIAVVVTDAPDAVAGTCVRQVNLALPRLRGFMRIPPDAPAPAQARVALFSRRADFDKFLRARKAPPAESFVCINLDDPARATVAAFVLEPRPLLARLRHAAFELMFRAWIAHPPPWLVEGLAECVEDCIVSPSGPVLLDAARGHLRDLRERVLEPEPSPALGLKELVRLDRAGWEARGLVACAESWGFARYMVEDQMCREVRLLQTVLAGLSPTAGEDQNLALSAAVFPADKWPVLERAWREYLDKLPETPGEEPYRKARAALARGETRAARALLDEAVGLDPEYERLYYFRAVAAAALGKQQAAIADLSRALALFPEYHAARFLRGQCRAIAKDEAGARDDFEACLATPYRDRAKKELEALKP